VEKFLRPFILILFVLTAGCDSGGSSSSSSSSGGTTADDDGPYLYVSSGACFSGLNTTFSTTTSSNIVYRIHLETGVREVIADYWAAPSLAGDSPTGIADIDSDYMYIGVDSATAANRRIERVAKEAYGARSTFYNASAFTGAIKYLFMNSAADLLLTRTTGIEYIDSSASRVGTPYGNPSGAPCASSNTAISKARQFSNGKTLFLHAAAGQNRIGILPTGTTPITTCNVVQAAPVANAYPSGFLYDSTNTKLIVSYAGTGTVTDYASIYSYNINESAPTIGGAQKLYDAANYPGTYSHLLYGISEMYYDQPRGHVYISTGITTASTIANYAIEKFTYDATKIGVDNANVLTRVGSSPFYNYGNDTKCINQMFVSD